MKKTAILALVIMCSYKASAEDTLPFLVEKTAQKEDTLPFSNPKSDPPTCHEAVRTVIVKECPVIVKEVIVEKCNK